MFLFTFIYLFNKLYFSAVLLSAGKSSVLLDVKPWDDETDMKKLEEAVRSIEVEGLHWGACKLFYFFYFFSQGLFFLWRSVQKKQYMEIRVVLCNLILISTLCFWLGYSSVDYAAKLVPVGYGIKKLTIMLTIVDDLVSVDSLIEERLTEEPLNEYIQSCDIVAFNKICKF